MPSNSDVPIPRRRRARSTRAHSARREVFRALCSVAGVAVRARPGPRFQSSRSTKHGHRHSAFAAHGRDAPLPLRRASHDRRTVAHGTPLFAWSTWTSHVDDLVAALAKALAAGAVQEQLFKSPETSAPLAFCSDPSAMVFCLIERKRKACIKLAFIRRARGAIGRSGRRARGRRLRRETSTRSTAPRVTTRSARASRRATRSRRCPPRASCARSISG